MNLFTNAINKKINIEIILPVSLKKYGQVQNSIQKIIRILHARIPDKKRISYGITYVIQTLSRQLSIECKKSNISLQKIFDLYHSCDNSEPRGTVIAVSGKSRFPDHHLKQLLNLPLWLRKSLRILISSSRIVLESVFKNLL
jgi:hypothetical protein